MSSKAVLGKGIIESAVDGVAGVFLLIAKFGLIVLGEMISIILGFFAGAGTGLKGISVQDVLFNKLEITDINFFDFSTTDATILAIRENVAAWYIGIRNLSAVLLVIVALYVGIRMAISTIAEDRAKYKQMLIDWGTSVCILFLLHYIMIFIIQTNNTIVKAIGNPLQNHNLNDVANEFRDFAIGGDGILNKIKNTVEDGFSATFAAAVIYLAMQFLTLIFLLTYIKRMITIAFLIIIAPLVTITYSIDKMGDGRSQALNQWLKEFSYNILIQPFQCVTYLALCSTSFEVLQKDPDFKSAVVAISMMVFLVSSEKIIRHIFNFRAESMADNLATAGIAASVFRSATSTSKKMFGERGSSEKAKVPKSKDENALPAGSSSNIQTTEINDGQQSVNGTTNNETQQSNETNQANDDTNQGADIGQAQNDAAAYIDNGSRGSEQIATREGGRKKANSRLRNAGLLATKLLLKGNAMAFGAGVGIATGIATGDLKAGLLASMEGVSMGSDWATRHSENLTSSHLKKEVARTFENYKAALQENGVSATDEDVAQYGLELLDGTRQAETKEERDFRDALLDMQNNYLKNGDDEKASLKHVGKVVEGVRDGEITEQWAATRFFGNIRDKVRRPNNGGTSSTTNTQTQQQQQTQTSRRGTRRTQPEDNSTPTPTPTPITIPIENTHVDIDGGSTVDSRGEDTNSRQSTNTGNGQTRTRSGTASQPETQIPGETSRPAEYDSQDE